jgi:hypothetical protein
MALIFLSPKSPRQIGGRISLNSGKPGENWEREFAIGRAFPATGEPRRKRPKPSREISNCSHNDLCAEKIRSVDNRHIDICPVF